MYLYIARDSDGEYWITNYQMSFVMASDTVRYYNGPSEDIRPFCANKFLAGLNIEKGKQVKIPLEVMRKTMEYV